MSAEPAAVSPEKSAVTAVTGASGAPATSTKPSFAHLHVHTEYSMLDGAARLDDLFQSGREMGMPAIAMTDHGNVFGAYDFWTKATHAGIKPIIGVEAYVTPGTHRRDTHPGHAGATAAARRRLRRRRVHPHDAARPRPPPACTTSSGSTLAGLARGLLLQAPHGPRAAPDRTPTGLIATTGCPSGEVQTRLRLGQYDEAREAAARVPGHLRQGELLPRADGPRPRDRAPDPRDLLRLAKDLGIPLVATNDLHYTKAEDGQGPRRAAVRPVRLDPHRPQPVQVRRRRLLPQVARARCATCCRELPEACDNTLLIAERCEVVVRRGRGPLHAAVPLPRGRDRGVLVRQGGRARPRSAATPSGVPTTRASRPSTRPTSSSRRASPATSSWSPTSSTGPRTTASGSARAVAPAPARCARTPWASPTSTRSRTA